MCSGSLLDISRYAYPDGFDEVTIATVLLQTLEGLKYLHQNGWLHRDVKAANLLVDGRSLIKGQAALYLTYVSQMTERFYLPILASLLHSSTIQTPKAQRSIRIHWWSEGNHLWALPAGWRQKSSSEGNMTPKVRFSLNNVRHLLVTCH